MLLLVRDEPRSVNEIAAHFDISQQAVSQHLRVLQGRRPRGCAPAGPAAAVHGAARGPRIARGVPRRAVAARASSASRPRSSPAMAVEPVVASIHIAAAAEHVFAYFTQADAMVRWMGDFARLDARPGGELAIDIHGTPVRGRYLELDPPHRLVFSWGHAGSDRLPPGASVVEVRLRPARRRDAGRRRAPRPARRRVRRRPRPGLARLPRAARGCRRSGSVVEAIVLNSSSSSLDLEQRAKRSSGAARPTRHEKPRTVQKSF